MSNSNAVDGLLKHTAPKTSHIGSQPPAAQEGYEWVQKGHRFWQLQRIKPVQRTA